MEAIVAVYSDWGIGRDGTQPIALAADRAHFRELTSGCAVIVGRRTMEDFPGGKPLKGRHNIIVTRQDIEIPGAQVVHSTKAALDAAAPQTRCLVIGGASVYKQFMPYITRVYVTKLCIAPESDSFFENLDASPLWTCIEEGPLLREGETAYRFCTYERIKTQE